VRLVAWNVAHAAREHPLKQGLLDGIASLDQDVLALNQYGSRAARYHEHWYRDPAPFCTAGTFNLTIAVQVNWMP